MSICAEYLRTILRRSIPQMLTQALTLIISLLYIYIIYLLHRLSDDHMCSRATPTPPITPNAIVRK